MIQQNKKSVEVDALTVADFGEFKLQELQLIWLIRTKYRYGAIEIQCRDGLPQDILRTIERIRLGSNTLTISTGRRD